MITIEKINYVIDWILNSDIQNPDGTKDIKGTDISGGFNAWFDTIKRKHFYTYTEISGYGLTTLLYLYSEEKNELYLKNAKRVGDFLISIQSAEGAFPTAFYHDFDSLKKPIYYVSFDIGMVLNSLTSLYRATNEEKYLNVAKKSGEWLINCIRKDGSIPAFVDCNGKILDSETTWSTQSGSFHAKLAIGFINLAEISKDKKYFEFTRKLCDYALTFQQKNGQFLTYGKLNGTHLHPHIYSCEGLLTAGNYFNESRYIKAAQLAAEWAVSNTKEGVVPRLCHNGKFNYNERFDVLAQAYRLALLLNLESSDQEAIAEKILKYQYFGEEKSQWGGFTFGKSSSGEIFPHVNSWVSFFAMQALKLKENPNLNYYHLI